VFAFTLLFAVFLLFLVAAIITATLVAIVIWINSLGTQMKPMIVMEMGLEIMQTPSPMIPTELSTATRRDNPYETGDLDSNGIVDNTNKFPGDANEKK